MEHWILRTACKEDFPRVAELFQEMIRSIYDLPPDAVVEGLKDTDLLRFLDGQNVIYIAQRNGHVEGFLSVENHGDFLYLDDLCVSKTCRGNGIGSSLLKQAEFYAMRKNICRIELHVEKENRRAVQLYERRGYLVTEVCGSRLRMRKTFSYRNDFLSEKSPGLNDRKEIGIITCEKE